MSKWYTQVTYKCNCDEGYGLLCKKNSRFVLMHNCSIDRTTIYHKTHIEEEGKYVKYNLPNYISDDEINALHKLLGEQPYNEKFKREGEEIDNNFFIDLKNE